MKRKPTERERELQRIRILLEMTKGKKDRKTIEERTALYRKLAALACDTRNLNGVEYEVAALSCDTRDLDGERYEVPERQA